LYTGRQLLLADEVMGLPKAKRGPNGLLTAGEPFPAPPVWEVPAYARKVAATVAAVAVPALGLTVPSLLARPAAPVINAASGAVAGVAGAAAGLGIPLPGPNPPILLL
jgi:hypothetical protein